MQTKDRERVNKKPGKVTIVRGSTPLKEGGGNQGRYHDEAVAAFLRGVRNVGESHHCKYLSTGTRGITSIPVKTAHGSQTFTPISFGTG